MSSDSEHIPKPSKRVRCRISDSESSDDSSPIRLNRRHRSAKFDSDDSNSDEDSDVQLPGRPRRRRVAVGEIVDTSSESGCSSQIVDNGTTDSEWHSDWESIEDSEEEECETVRKRKAPKLKPETTKSAHSESEDSDGQAEKCPICLLAFRNQEVGTPSACDHCFCLICLTEWSKNVNTCPVDRQEFRSITVRSRFGGEITRQIPVEVREHKSDNELENDATYCQICEQCDREERMLLCDGCDLGYHMECLNPPMNQVPIEEWFCPRCSNNQNLAESVEIDLDEVPDLMAEARLLGVTYGRTRSGPVRDQELFGRYQPMHRQRLVPRTRQTERVRANIRAGRSRDLETEIIPRVFDPDQPSTSSGFESISENSRGRSPYNLPVSRSRRNVATTAKRSRRGSRKKTNKTTTTDSYTVQEVRIRELDAQGIERETVTYVTVKQKTSRKYKKRSIKKRKKRKRKPGCRGRNCQVPARTVKSRLAQALGLVKSRKGARASATTVNNAVSIPSQIELTNLRYRAGIPQLNLFGENRMLDYVPLGSDDELDNIGAEDGSIVGVQRRNTSMRVTNRRRLALKGIPDPHEAPAAAPVDLLSSIISSQELWHSRESKNNITLKADGTLLLPNKETNVEKDVVDKKPKVPNGSDTAPEPDSKSTPDTTTINSADIIQAPMYSSSRAGGIGNSNNPGDGGSFRGNYHDRGNHGHGGQDYGLRDSYSGGGRLNYGGPGPRGPPGGFGHDIRPPLDFNPNFDNRRRPPPGGMPHFRHRPHMNFRDNRRGRFPMDRGPFRGPVNMSQGPVFPHPNHFQGSTNVNNSNNSPLLPNPRINVPPPRISPEIQTPEVIPAVQPTSEGTTATPAVVDSVTPEEPTVELPSERADGEDCDIYCDMEAPNKPADNAEINLDHREAETEDTSGDDTLSTMLPPPEPPSDLLDYDDKSDKDESDGEDLVIDDTPKETEESAKTEDKYDPFSVGDSDSNDSSHERRKKKPDDKKDASSVKEGNSTPPSMPLAPPPTPPDFSLLSGNTHEGPMDSLGSLARLGAYDEDDDDDSQDDCPNFSIYSSETMDVARHTEQELSQQIGPLEPPPMPPEIPDDDDCIVADVQACDLSDIPEPVDPYVASLQKERQTLSKLPPKKISTDSRGKITFKIGNKLKLNNRLTSLYDELDDSVEVTVEKDKSEAKEPASSTDKTSKSEEKILSSESTEDQSIFGNSEKKFDDKLEPEDAKATAEVENKPTSDESSEEAAPAVTPVTEELSLTPEPVLEKFDEVKKDPKHVEEPQEEELELSHTPESTSKADFELQKENTSLPNATDAKTVDEWESDGAYTPCKDEMPVKDKIEQMSSFESGLEPITPPAKDRSSDDLGRCPTPIEYAGLGTEAISETDEAINFEDEPPTVVSQRKEKEIEEGEIADDKLNKKQSDKSDTDDANRKKKKERRKQVAEKNKENISSDNQVAWKKISKSTKDRQYREKGKNLESREKDKGDSEDKSPRDKGKYREKSKEKTKKKLKDTCDKKKEKRKELPRYDVRKIVAEKPARQRKDEYGRDIRDLSRTMSRSRSPVRTNKRSHSREFRLSRSYSPRMNSRSSRSWSRRLARSWSRNRQSPAHKRSVSRSRRKSPVRERRSLSRRRSRSPLARRSRRSLSNQRQRRNRRSVSRKYRSRSRSWSRSRSRSKVRSRTRSRSRNARAKDKSKKHKSRSRSKRRKRSRSKTPPPRKATSKSRTKKRNKRSKLTLPNNSHSVAARSRSRDRSYSRDRSRRNWSKATDKAADRSSFAGRGETVGANATWSAQWTPSWSRSRSRTPPLANRSHNDHMMSSHDWSPSPSSLAALAAPSGSAFPPSSPPSQSSGLAPASGILGAGEPIDGVTSPKNLTVILRNKDAIKNKKRKDKRAKERKKSRETERRKVSNKRNRTPPPSKEVFASGDNILVSVCFNNENASGQAGNAPPHLTDPLPLLSVTKRRHREPVVAETAAKKPKKDKSKDKRSKSPTKTNRRDKKRKSKAAEIAATKKPVAVIDLDQSPFREQTPSPRDVIVLSDDDQDDDHNNNHSNMNDSSEGNVGNAGASHTGGSNNDGNINKNMNLNDDDDDDDDEEPANLRVQEPQRRLSSSLQLMQQQQQQLQLQLQAEQGGKGQEEEQEMSHQDQLQQLHLQQRCSVVSEHDFMAQGPKTPPEPQVKFSIKQSGNLRPTMLHPMFDGDDDEEIEGDSNAGNNAGDNDKCANERSGALETNKLATKDNSGEGGEDDDEGMDEDDDVDNDDMMDEEDDEEEADGGRNEQDKKSLDKEAMDDLESGKIGPNTPPEPPSSPMTSPDAYDPFDPTKSRSPTPDVEETLSNDQKLESTEALAKESANDKSELDKPKMISMVTIKHAPSPGKDAALSGGESMKMDGSSKDITAVSSVNSYVTSNPVLATVAAAVQRSFSAQRNISQTNHISPSNQLKQRTTDRAPQLGMFMGTGKNRVTKANRNSSVLGQNGNDLESNNDTVNVDTSSPYSPGSSLSDGMFDPPSPARNHHSPGRPSGPSNIMKNAGNNSKAAKGDKKDLFDSLFGSSPSKSGANAKLRAKKISEKRKKASNSKIGVRMDENQLQILDDLPSSAVEMQVKDKFLKKLNRQERVVEEVKLVLKPHYTKKHVTKDEYKDIMRKAVPKICHNRTGEINPKKIAQLVEAYVKRCRSNKRKVAPGGLGNTVAKAPRPQKNPWS